MPARDAAEDSFERLCSFENLYEAARQSRKGKRFENSTARFHHDLAKNLVRLRDELLDGTYRPGPYREFTIYEPARRFISAAPYRDRVVHHALCQVTQALFERSFVFDSYANRKGKGTHRALDRCTHYMRRYRYVLQADVRLFFPSIDHEVLLERLGRKIRDARTLGLADLILRHSNEQPAAGFYFPGDNLFTPFERRKGLPIGNLTSQLWANVYLDPLDHLVKDQWGAPGYIRYVDDFLVFADDKRQLWKWLRGIRAALAGMRLLLNERKTRVYPVEESIPFLGFRLYRTHRRLLPGGVKRARRRLARLSDGQAKGEVSREQLQASVRAWIAHASHGNTEGLRRRLLEAVVIRAGGHSSASGRVVEQQSRQRGLREPQQQRPAQQ